MNSGESVVEKISSAEQNVQQFQLQILIHVSRRFNWNGITIQKKIGTESMIIRVWVYNYETERRKKLVSSGESLVGKIAVSMTDPDACLKTFKWRRNEYGNTVNYRIREHINNKTCPFRGGGITCFIQLSIHCCFVLYFLLICGRIKHILSIICWTLSVCSVGSSIFLIRHCDICLRNGWFVDCNFHIPLNEHNPFIIDQDVTRFVAT